ncbi:MAG TPA: hypothetical protein VK654_01325 [Nitrospirota bacterium]|nr:hypothetical protein [Nitrospirota bacterium]
MRKLLFLISSFLLLAPPAFAKLDPSFTWTIVETPHFVIYYHQGEEEIAKRAVVIAEDVHDRLVPRIKWDPTGKTHMVLVDAMDEPNGLTTPFPYNHITLYVTQPLGEPGFGTTAYDDWLRLLITHEYTHILHLDMVTGVPEKIQNVLGRIYFPNLVEPIWMIEGLATYEETEQTSGGRGRSPGAEMIIRMAVLEDRFPSLGRASTYPDTWPAGDVPYLFGEGFTKYIADTYGREKLADISLLYSSRGVPFLVNSTGYRVLRAEYSDLWEQWKADLRNKYSRLRDELAAKGLTASLPLTKRGYLNVSPAFSPDGSRIAYSVLNGDEFPGIYIMNADGTRDHRVVERYFSTASSGASIAWSPDGKGIYYSKLDVVHNTDVYSEIYYFDLAKNNEVCLTDGLRARDPFPSPDGRKLIFVTNKIGKNRLGTIDVAAALSNSARAKDVAWLSGESDVQYETPRFSPDGTRIVTGVRKPDGSKAILILDSRGSKIDEITDRAALIGGAAWSVDGTKIFYTSDRTGIFNIYVYDTASKKTYQVTSVLGGAFTPMQSPDGRALVFTSYSSRGYDLHLRTVDPAAWKTPEPTSVSYPAMTYAMKPVPTTAGSYNPLPTLYPRFWLPFAQYNYESGVLPGFLTMGQDALERHTYLIQGYYSPKNYRKWYSFDYLYDGLYPTFYFHASDIDQTYGDLLSDPSGTHDYTQREKTVDLSAIIPLLKVDKQHVLTVGYRRTNISDLTHMPPWPGYSGVIPAQGLLASGRAVYEFNNAKQYSFSISPEGGRTIALGYEEFSKPLGSDFSFRKYTADWHEYVDFPWPHHVLQVRAFAGTSIGDTIPQGAFQLGGDYPGDVTIPVDDNSVYLRGYPTNEFRGRRAALASLEYRLPIWNIEAGPGNGPIFFRRVHAAFFAESGDAWNEGFHIRDFKSAVGTEARLDTYFAYSIPITFRIGIAKGLDEKRETMLIFNLWMPSLL